MNEFLMIAEGIDINEFEDGYVIYRSEKDKIHYLNKKTVLVLQACTGENSASDLVTIVKDAYNLEDTPEKEVSDCLKSIFEEGLVQ